MVIAYFSGDREAHYFSTHGCSGVSFFVVGAFDALSFAAAACLAFILKKSAILNCVLVERGVVDVGILGAGIES